MNKQNAGETLLAGFRALDLTDEKGFLCGKILGDLGVDVLKLEKPGGDPSRNLGPFYGNYPDPEKSLSWFAFNANKRGITLNIETREGQDIFKKLVPKADFVIESFPPGYMDGLGLGYPALSKLNPRLVMTSITPFGQSGPYRDYQASDIVAMAMGGIMHLCGDPDRPPVRISFPQSYLLAGAQAAGGTMIAHYHREVTGEGQQVDVSIVESVILLLFQARPYWDLNRVVIQRAGPSRGGVSQKTTVRLIWPCKDGEVFNYFWGGKFGATSNRGLVELMEQDGLDVASLKKKDWEAWDRAQASQEELDEIAQPAAELFRAHTKAELYEEALKRKIWLYPVYTTKEIVSDPQLSARGFWQEVEHPELGTSITYPGAYIKLSHTPLRTPHRAPLIGEHNQEVYQQELGLSKKEILWLKQGGII